VFVEAVKRTLRWKDSRDLDLYSEFDLCLRGGVPGTNFVSGIGLTNVDI
jgi:hypothetical protein